MTPGANGTMREALVAGLRDALEPEVQNGAGRGGVSRATQLAAGAALAAAATPLAKRGSTTLRSSSGGRALRMVVYRSGLPDKAARRITDANRAVQDWTARQQQKRGVLTNVEAAESRPVLSQAADERSIEPERRPERIERVVRQGRASRMWASSESSRRRTTNASLQSPSTSTESSRPRKAKPSRAASASPKSRSSAKGKANRRPS